MEHKLRNASGWILVFMLVYAPWAMGCALPPEITGLAFLAAICVGLWLWGCLAERRFPRIPWPCLAAGGFLLAEGWWMAFNAHTIFRPGFPLQPDPRTLWPAAPGSVDGWTSCDMMIRVTALLAVMCAACDLARAPVWRMRFWWTIVLTGGALALFGLVEKAGLSHLALSQMEAQQGFPFATYNYHGNAGAYLNLVIPAALGLALLRTQKAPRERIVLWGCLVACLVGAVVNVSRGAQLVTLIVLGITGTLLLAGRISQTIQHVRSPAAFVVAAVILVACLAGIGGREMRRWSSIGSDVQSDSSRPLAWGIGWAMARDAGPLGSGPGSFKIRFPHTRHMNREIYSRWIMTEYVPGQRVSMWSNLHQDYLQTIIEWGWVGAAAWGLLLFGGLARLWVFALRPAKIMPVSDRFLVCCSAAALTGICLHALIDFPFQVASLELYTALYLSFAWGDWSNHRNQEGILPGKENSFIGEAKAKG